jgi:hypothetical protein
MPLQDSVRYFAELLSLPWTKNVVILASVSPNGQRLVFVCQVEHGTHLVQRNLQVLFHRLHHLPSNPIVFVSINRGMPNLNNKVCKAWLGKKCVASLCFYFWNLVETRPLKCSRDGVNGSKLRCRLSGGAKHPSSPPRWSFLKTKCRYSCYHLLSQISITPNFLGRYDVPNSNGVCLFTVFTYIEHK